MTKDIDLSTMTNNKEIIPQYRNQLEADLKDIFIWAIGQNAITAMTKTVGERDPSSLPLHKVYTLFDYTSSQKGTYTIAEPIFST